MSLAAKGQKFDENTVLYVRTWLLNIEAFNRLFPEKFSENAIPWQNENKSQDNSHWGQFIDKDKNIKQDLVAEFKDKYQSEYYEDFNLYFPNKALYSEMKIVELLSYYRI